MLSKRKIVQYTATGLVTLLLSCSALLVLPQFSHFGDRVIAPAEMNGVVTITTSPDNKMAFITCIPDHVGFLKRVFHTNLSAAFVAQLVGSEKTSVSHSGTAHIVFRGDLLDVVFSDSSRFLFTTSRKQLAAQEILGCSGSYVGGIATYSVSGVRNHADFVSSRDWTRRTCGL